MGREEKEGVNKVVIILALVGVIVMGAGLYAYTLAGPIVGAGIFFIGAYLLVMPMSKALL